MHAKIKEAVDNDLQIIKQTCERLENFKENIYQKVVLSIAQTFPNQQNDNNIKTYEEAYHLIQKMIPHDIEEKLSDALNDLNTWLVGNNWGYDDIAKDIIGSSPQQEVYDYLIGHCL